LNLALNREPQLLWRDAKVRRINADELLVRALVAHLGSSAVRLLGPVPLDAPM
jgi:hypothetical protein